MLGTQGIIAVACPLLVYKPLIIVMFTIVKVVIFYCALCVLIPIKVVLSNHKHVVVTQNYAVLIHQLCVGGLGSNTIHNILYLLRIPCNEAVSK